MSNEIKSIHEFSPEEVAKAIIKGTATETEQGVALKALQTALSSTLIQGMQSISRNLVRLQSTLDNAYAQLAEREEADLGLMGTQDLVELIDRITTKQLQVLDLYRRTIQGKELFPTDTLSEDEKKVLRLVNSFSSKEEKQRFFQLVQESLHKVESAPVEDFSESSHKPTVNTSGTPLGSEPSTGYNFDNSESD